jgi:hypothetical protein
MVWVPDSYVTRRCVLVWEERKMGSTTKHITNNTHFILSVPYNVVLSGAYTNRPIIHYHWHCNNRTTFYQQRFLPHLHLYYHPATVHLYPPFKSIVFSICQFSRLIWMNTLQCDHNTKDIWFYKKVDDLDDSKKKHMLWFGLCRHELVEFLFLNSINMPAYTIRDF